MERGLRCTRSQAAPDWTIQECLILVNEINAIEGEWKHALASFQKWQLVVENCNALDVNRNLNQCKRKWEALFSEYGKVKPYESAYWAFELSKRRQLGLPENFSAEIFQAIDKYVTERRDEDLGSAVGPESDPDSDPEAQLEDGAHDVVLETGFKRHHKRALPQKRKVEERLNPWRHVMGRNIKHEQYSLNERVEPPKRQTVGKVKTEPGSILDERVLPPKSWTVEKLKPEPGSAEGEEQMMAANLLENARMINSVLEGNLGEDMDYKLADLKNYEATQTDFTRLQGDKLIQYLGKFANNLKQLCDHLQECN